jgi:lipoprotein-anchoring transpeptidase ErfK/SrfK
MVPTEEEMGEEITQFERYQVLEVLSVVTDTNRTRWFEVQPGEWISDDDFAYVEKVQPNPTRGATDRWISVNLSEQYLVAYENNLPIYAALVSTGKETGWATGSGIFTVFHKDESFSLFSPDPNIVGNYLIQDVPFILYYQGSFAVHGAYWHDNFGLPNSHGCVNLSLTDAEWLFNWAEEGEWVVLYRD